jgi:hypothetical protein
MSTPARTLDLGPWLWSARRDLCVFGGSAGFALGLVALGHWFGFGGGELPEWGFLAFVLAIDVAHVHSTLFRTYLDREELARHPARYALVPVLAYGASVALYAHAPLMFWRVLAYVALFHFIRQQVGWVAVYRARAKNTSALDRFLDEATVYAVTLYPVVAWHAHLSETRFAWFLTGDFVSVESLARAVLPLARASFFALLGAFLLRQGLRAFTARRLELGKTVVVIATALSWYVGIVATNSDFDFTVTNVITHGVPYAALLWAYVKERRKDEAAGLPGRIAGLGLSGFVVVLVALAFVEEFGWDALVWHDRPWLFGAGIELGARSLIWLVPLLALPQATHYVLDGMLWRRADTRARPAQKRALGFGAT